jgi:YHS domain-containing protein
VHKLGSTQLKRLNHLTCWGPRRISMTFIVRMLRYLFWVVIVTWSVAILRRLVRQMGSDGIGSRPHVDVSSDAVTQKLVRDPICGMHVAEGLALALQQGGETVFFCSAECRDKYLSQTRKLAANG